MSQNFDLQRIYAMVKKQRG